MYEQYMVVADAKALPEENGYKHIRMIQTIASLKNLKQGEKYKSAVFISDNSLENNFYKIIYVDFTANKSDPGIGLEVEKATNTGDTSGWGWVGDGFVTKALSIRRKNIIPEDVGDASLALIFYHVIRRSNRNDLEIDNIMIIDPDSL
jgi:hypothetical protein